MVQVSELIKIIVEVEMLALSNEYWSGQKVYLVEGFVWITKNGFDLNLKGLYDLTIKQSSNDYSITLFFGSLSETEDRTIVLIAKEDKFLFFLKW